MTSRALFLSLVVVSACDRGRPAPGTEIPASSSLQPLLLAQSALLPGTTAVDPSRAAAMFVSSNNPPALAKVMGAFNRYFKLTDAAGTELPVHGTVLPSKTSTFNATVEVLPDAPLREDQWYTLTVLQGADLQISNDRTIAELNARPTAEWKIPFFTGSAPYVRAIEMPTGEKDGAYVRVHLSEPVRLADLDPVRVLTAGGRAHGKCILQGGECAASMGDTVAEVVDIAPAGRIGDMSGSLVVNLGRNVRGSGRTVGEGFAAARLLTRGAQLQGRDLSRELVATGWRSCHDGASRCWTAATASASVNPL